MIITTMRLERPEGTSVNTGLTAQYDLAVIDPKADMGRDRDYLVYDVYLEYLFGLTVRRRDVLIDEQNIDPLTGASVRMRVYAIEQFERDHFEARCEQIIGS